MPKLAVVSAHVVGPGKTRFGSLHADEWGTLMQHADAPRAFLHGASILRKKYTPDPEHGVTGDPWRLAYLEILARSPQKAHYMRPDRCQANTQHMPRMHVTQRTWVKVRDMVRAHMNAHTFTRPRFTNAVLTDVTESLFSAMKRWVSKRNEQQVTLHQAVVRICAGCLAMAQKPYLYNPGKSALYSALASNKCQEVRELFVALSQRVTRKALSAMYDDFNTNRERFDVDKDIHKDSQAWVQRMRCAST